VIVVDTSALMAIALSEFDSDHFGRLIATSSAVLMPASSYLECVIVLRGRRIGRGWLDELITSENITLLGSDARQAHLAADAFERYGRGSAHPARLNFGDCLVYAAAKALDVPLLFKGDDFRATDLTAAL
jgi:ribonuclease VapC